MDFKKKSFLNYEEIISFLNKEEINENSLETLILFFICDCKEYGKITKNEFEKIKNFSKKSKLKNFLIFKKKEIFENLEKLRKLFFFGFDFYSLENKYFKISVYKLITNFILEKNFLEEKKNFFNFLKNEKIEKIFIDDCKFSYDIFKKKKKNIKKQKNKFWPQTLQNYITK